MLNSLIFDFTIFSDLKLFCLEERFKQMLQYTLDLHYCYEKKQQHVDIKELSFVFLVGFKSKRGKCLGGNTKEKVKGEIKMIQKDKRESEREMLQGDRDHIDQLVESLVLKARPLPLTLTLLLWHQ